MTICGACGHETCATCLRFTWQSKITTYRPNVICCRCRVDQAVDQWRIVKAQRRDGRFTSATQLEFSF
jgi:hypothetical protein